MIQASPRAMSWIKEEISLERINVVFDGFQKGPAVPPWKVRSADRAGKQSISRQEQLVRLEKETNAAGRVTWCRDDNSGTGADGDLLSVTLVTHLRWRLRFGKAKNTGLNINGADQRSVFLMNVKRHPISFTGPSRSGNVVDVPVCRGNSADLCAMTPNHFRDALIVPTDVHKPCAACFPIHDEVGVDLKWPNRDPVYYE